MKWAQPPATEKGRPTLSREYFITCGEWVICKALTPAPVYTLSRKGELVCSGTLDECKRRASDETAD